MRKGGGKSKGSSFEREICRELSLWVSNGKQEDIFWRSSISGGRSTVAYAKGKRFAAQAGDISCVDPAGFAFTNRFYIECKFYKDLDYIGLITGKGHLIDFWEETKLQAKKYKKLPLLIAKQNRIPAMACLGLAGAVTLGLEKRSLLIATRNNMRIIPLYEFFKYAQRPD